MDQASWIALFTSSPALILYVTIALWAFHRLAAAKKIDDEKWDGYIHQAILMTNEAGLAPHEPGWLQAATNAFETVYQKHTGSAPTTQDLSDAATDLARTAGPVVLQIIGKIVGSGTPPAGVTKATSVVAMSTAATTSAVEAVKD